MFGEILSFDVIINNTFFGIEMRSKSTQTVCVRPLLLLHAIFERKYAIRSFSDLLNTKHLRSSNWNLSLLQ